MKNKPLILITNDDGINSPGIETLKNSLSEIADVIIVAPDTQKSAVSSALTISKPLRVSKFHKNNLFFGYAVNGTPTDCVKLALSTLFDRKPDLVVSGINHGKNTSINVMYSGTVAGASEGYLAGINSIAISHSSHALNSDLEPSGRFCQKLARKLLSSNHQSKVFLNVNLPDISADNIKGAYLTKLSSSKWADKYERRQDPFGNEYFWFAGEFRISDSGIDTDDGAIESSYISVTPLKLNVYDCMNSDDEFIKELSDDIIEFGKEICKNSS